MSMQADAHTATWEGRRQPPAALLGWLRTSGAAALTPSDIPTALLLRHRHVHSLQTHEAGRSQPCAEAGLVGLRTSSRNGSSPEAATRYKPFSLGPSLSTAVKVGP